MPEVLLAPQHVDWLIKQPNDILSSWRVHDSVIGLRYVVPSEAYQNRFQNDLLLHKFTRHFGAFTAKLAAEVESGIKDQWGDDITEWKEIEVYRTLQEVAMRVNQLVLVGQLLNRNKMYLKACEESVKWLAQGGASIRFLPSFLQPILGPLCALPFRYWRSKVDKYVIPLIKVQIRKVQSEGPSVKRSEATLLESLTERALAYSNRREHSPQVIAARLHLVNLASTHTTAFTLTNLIFNLAGTDPTSSIFDRLRNEAIAALAKTKGQWSRQTIAMLEKHDSCIRETLRYTGFGGRGMMHEVMSKNGVELPDGNVVPKGTWIGMPIGSIHRDEDRMSQANVYEPLRFAPKGGEEAKRKPLVKPDDGFLAFGMGRNAWCVENSYYLRILLTTKPCSPGRFFAAHQLKLILAVIIMNYDVEYRKRPKIKYFSDFALPPLGDTISIRRRRGNQ
jgi:cytochrome P450